jgi:hypothetical protein
MRANLITFTLAVLVTPQSLIAAEAAISCVLTKEEVYFVSKSSPDGATAQRDINGTANFTVASTALRTALASPCDSIDGAVSGTNINAMCSFLPDKSKPSSITIQIDRQLGTISETWDITEYDGTNFRYFISGTCTNNPAS